MQIAALDLMPLLWSLSIALSVALFLYGDRASLIRTVPAAIAALVLYATGYPPRFQVAIFLALYVLCTAIYGVITLLGKREKQQADDESLRTP